MKFKNPIIFFDLETTGVDTMNDKIVQIATVKILPNGERESKEYLINPDRPIPKEASDVHGITDEMVKDKPLFSKYARALNDYYKGCDIGGYNSNQFDMSMLIEEFKRCGIDFDTTNRNYVDVMKLEAQLNPRTLEAVYQRYTGNNIENAHDALADVNATIEVLENQIEAHGLTLDTAELDKISQGDNLRVDVAGKLCNIDGKICWSFGKHKGNPVKDTPSYANWFLGQSVPSETEKIIREQLKK